MSELTEHPDLCSDCRLVIKAFSFGHDDGVPSTRNVSIKEKILDDSAAGQCRLCELFLASMDIDSHTQDMLMLRDRAEADPSISHCKSDYYCFYKDGLENYSIVLVYAWRTANGTYLDWSATSSLKLCQAKGEIFQGSSLDSKHATSTGSQNTLSRAKQWLDSCLSEHMGCKRSVQTVPSRLMDVGVSPTCDGHSDIRLCCSSSYGPDVQYLTLSHCWGKVTPLRLLLANKEEFEKGIPQERLPPLFQSAIRIVRSLGHRYIWIDSLCIVQDSKEDWELESAQMCDIYSGSICNIAATARSGSEKPIFFERPVSKIHRLVLSLGVGDFEARNHRLLQNEIENSPLYQRAWVCQERFLAPRSLHFGATQLFWECNERIACELYPELVPEQETKPDSAFPKYRSLCEKGTFEKMWKSMITAYSRANLTFETDKLVAISGIAKAAQKEHNDQYLAGLWRSQFPHNLLWSVQSMSKKTSSYIAPSWSWAAVSGPVFYPKPDWKHEDSIRPVRDIEIIDLQVDVNPTNPLGTVKGGFLKLKGNPAMATINRSYTDSSNAFVVNTTRYLPLCIETQAGPKKITARGLVDSDSGVEKKPFAGCPERILCLPIFEEIMVEETQTSIHTLPFKQLYGLLLEATEVEKDHYIRIGMFMIGNDEEIEVMNDGCRFYRESLDNEGMIAEREEASACKLTITITII